jgi:hypothetical protein
LAVDDIETEPNPLKFDADTLAMISSPYNKLNGDAKNEVMGIVGHEFVVIVVGVSVPSQSNEDTSWNRESAPITFIL